MPGANLTRVEAQERKAIVETQHYDVALDLTTGPETFHALTRVTFTATPGATTFIDAITEHVHRVTLNGEDLDAAAVSDGVRIALPALAESNELIIDATMRYTNTGEGLHRFVDPADGEVYLYSQFEVPDARRMYPNFEQPDLKASFAFSVTAPDHWQVISNEAVLSREPAGEGSATWVFATTPRISTYITALVAGPYTVFTDELVSADGRTIPLGVYCRASLAEYMDADNIFTTTKQGFEYYESGFGVPYPFTKYDQLFVPEYNAGAMENAGCVTFTESYVFRSRVPDAIRERRVVTILHELGHMWFGDLVTMKWWNDLWLNESFAEFISTIACAEATEWTDAWTTFLAMEKSWAYRQDQLPSTHPIVAEITDLDDVLVNFDGITYAKGGSVLKQLFAWVGREPFFRGLHEYFVTYGWGNTELADLLAEFEKASGRDLSAWAEKWLATAGVNTLRPIFALDAEGRFSHFAIEQSAPDDYPTLRPHRLAVGIYAFDGDELRRTDRVELDIDGAHTTVPELIGVPRGDLILVNDDDLAYAKIRLDERSLTTAIASVGRIAEALPRALVLGSAWDATRDGEMRARDFIRLVLEYIATETESTTRRMLLAQMLTAVHVYTAPDARVEITETVADELWALAEGAVPGSDAQFTFVRSFAQIASTPEQLDAVAALFEGRQVLDELDIDTDLGWELLFALVAGGRAGEPEIAARLESDRTADGERSAAHARAAIPTPEGKRAAWESVVTAQDAPNAIVRATALGFWQTHDDGLVAPFVEPYFSTIASIWDSRSYHIAEYLIEGFFPSLLATRDVADAAHAWLAANTDRPAALRRMIIEGVDSLERSLRVQERDGRD